MKLSLTLFIGLILVALSILLFASAIESVINANDLYKSMATGHTKDFKVSFYFITFTLALLASFALANAIAFFKVFGIYYTKRQTLKRDKAIKTKIIDAAYEDLYNNYNNASTLEERNKLVEDFYNKQTSSYINRNEKPIPLMPSSDTLSDWYKQVSTEDITKSIPLRLLNTSVTGKSEILNQEGIGIKNQIENHKDYVSKTAAQILLSDSDIVTPVITRASDIRSKRPNLMAMGFDYTKVLQTKKEQK